MYAYSPVQNLSLAGAVAYCVFSLHQYEPRPGILLSSHASGDGAGGCEGGSGGEHEHREPDTTQEEHIEPVPQATELQLCEPCEPCEGWQETVCEALMP